MLFHAVFVFILGFPLSATSAQAPSTNAPISVNTDNQSCREISERDRQLWNQKSHVDLATILHDRLIATHQDLYPRTDSSRFQQAETLVRAFDADTWIDRFRSSSENIRQEHRARLEFLFSFWVREKYLGVIARAAGREEQTELKFFGARMDTNLRAQIQKYPAEPRVTRIATFHCTNAQDSRSYRCGEPHVAIDVQLSARLLCTDGKNPNDSRLRFIVRLDSLRGPLITDVERGPERIYQNTLLEYTKLKSKMSSDEIYSALKQRAFFSPADFNEIPGSGLLSLRDNESRRLPAAVQSSPTKK